MENQELATQDTEKQMWENAKEGDTFYAVDHHRLWSYARPLKVVRTTKTLLILEGDTRVSRSSHSEPNKAYSTTSYYPAAPSVLKRIADAKALVDLKQRSAKAFEKAGTLNLHPDFVAQLEALLEKF
jgi:hypothetical protein